MSFWIPMLNGLAVSIFGSVLSVSFCSTLSIRRSRIFLGGFIVFLSAFAGRAERAGISINVQGAIPAFILISDSDLCVLLSNALENAIYACQPIAAAGTPCRLMSGAASSFCR